MAFDGITVKNIVHELTSTMTGARISKIAQPEKDELLLTIKSNSGNYRLLISVNPSLPLVYLTEDNKQSPLTAPTFCMLLRKHIGSGRIISISQPGLERVIDMVIEHLDDFGEVCQKHLFIELMGKYSNIIFTDDSMKIIDSIRHVPSSLSSVREVLPGRDYFIPNTTSKCDPLTIDRETFEEKVFERPIPLPKAIQSTFTGLSNIIAEEIILRTGIDASTIATEVESDLRIHIYNIFNMFMDEIRNNTFAPTVYYKDSKPVEYAAISLGIMSDLSSKSFERISDALYSFYDEKNSKERMSQKTTDIRHLVSGLIEKDNKKLQMWDKQLKSCEDADKYRIYGELINTYGYSVPDNSASFTAINYYTNEEITIPLDKTISVRENSLKYFSRYQKLKRTKEAVLKLHDETVAEIMYLESVENAIQIAKDMDDINAIRQELELSGFAKRKVTKANKNKMPKSKPLHYISTDGFHIYVGKNNLQNEELSLHFASNSDWWFHAKEFAGSHVIVKTEGKEMTDRTFEEAAALAAYYSKGASQDKVEVDYTLKKNLKKPQGSAAGYVIYHQNYSLTIAPSNKLTEL